MGLHGVDVSSWQGGPGSWQGDAGAISWAGVKFTELSGAGPYTSPVAAADWAWLGARQVGRVAYLFGHPATPVAATVSLFLAAVTQTGLADGDMICLDHEVNDGVSPAAAAGWALSVLVALGQRTGRRPLLYTFPSFAAEGNCAGLGSFPLWLADPNHPAGQPAVPAPWHGWAIHQYAITGPIDQDTANYPSLAAMRGALGKLPATQPPTLLEDETMPILMDPGAGAVTPLAMPAGTKHLVLVTSSAAQVGVQFHNHGTTTFKLDWQPDGAQVVPVPAGVQAALLHRIDAGTADVSVACQAA